MRYRQSKNFKPYKAKGKLRKPAYMGLMVLLDYLNPGFADKYRELMTRRERIWNKYPREHFMYADTGGNADPWSDKYNSEAREAAMAPELSQLQQDWEALCKRAAKVPKHKP